MQSVNHIWALSIKKLLVMKQKQLTLNIYVQQREPGPLSPYERKQLADFFIAIMDLASQKKEFKNLKNEKKH